MDHLRAYQPWEPFDVVTISGSGEPTLAANLGEVITALRDQTQHPVVVLSNGTLLQDEEVRQELVLADQVAVKLDGITSAQVERVNRPLENFDLEQILRGLDLFRQEYAGHLGLQTMILTLWSDAEKSAYIEMLKRVQPDEVQLNIPSRPRVLSRQIWARGNQPPLGTQTHGLRKLNCVNQDVLTNFADRIQSATGIHVRCAPSGQES
jgi:wyosine [tRNA(Phe)-imidazoG37] synthetase (radical SAM superfamily)